MTAAYFRARQIRTEWDKLWGTEPPPPECAHLAPWTVVCRVDVDGVRYLQEVCPWCNQLLGRRPVPKVTA